MERLTELAVPLLLGLAAGLALIRGADLYAVLTEGIRGGLGLLPRLFPSLLAILCAVSLLRASGALEAITGLLAPALRLLGIPEETAPLLLIRPLSGSGALAAASELMARYGPDSPVGRTAAVMLGSTETTFYTVAVYFGAAEIKRSRHTVPAALVADLTGFVCASLFVRLFFGQ